MKKNTLVFIGIVLSVFFCVWSVSAQQTTTQQWKEIIPLVSTCADIKKIFNVANCEFPSSRFRFSKYWINVHFSTDKDEWTVSNDTVVYVSVSLLEMIKLRDYETDLKDYKIAPEDDVPEILIYKNDKKGVKLTVQEVLHGELYITGLSLYPSQANKEKADRKK